MSRIDQPDARIIWTFFENKADAGDTLAAFAAGVASGETAAHDHTIDIVEALRAGKDYAITAVLRAYDFYQAMRTGNWED